MDIENIFMKQREFDFAELRNTVFFITNSLYQVQNMHCQSKICLKYKHLKSKTKGNSLMLFNTSFYSVVPGFLKEAFAFLMAS